MLQANQADADQIRGAKVLVTGAALAAEAEALLRDHGAEILYIDGYQGPDVLRDAAAAHQVDAILVRQGQITPQVIAASSRLRVIAKHGSGVDNIDLAAATAKGIPVLRALAANAQSVAELAITLSVSLIKDLVPLDTAVKAGGWPKTKYIGRDLAGARFGIVGFGEIGRRTAKLAQALGMQTLAYDPFAQSADGTEVTSDLKALLEASDIVSLHCPLTPETQNLINAESLSWMKSTAFLVNTARGAVVDEDALYDALISGKIAGAALDSFVAEPPRPDHPLLTLGNVIATPHVGGASRSAIRNMAYDSASHIVTVLSGEPFPRNALANRDLA